MMNSSPTPLPSRPPAPALAFLIATVLLAWLPLITSAILVADDNPYARLSAGGISPYLARLGFWRILGQHLPMSLYLLHPILPAFLTLATHLLGTVLLYRTARVLLGGEHLPLVLALVFGVFPLGYQALVWLIAYNYALAAMLFLANLLLVATAPPGRGAIAASCALSLGSALSNESLILALVFSGVLAWRRSRLLALAPATGVLLWLLLYRVKDISSYKAVAFHFPTVFSTYWYQYSLLDPFLAWKSAACRALLFHGWTPALALAIGVSAVIAGYAFTRLPAGESRVPASSYFVALVLGAFLLGISAIFAVGGGFSLDTRKKYVILPVLLLAAGWLWRRTGWNLPARLRRPALVGMTLAGVATTWLVVGVWKHETAVYDRLADTLADALVADVSLHRESNPANEWPAFERTLGFRLDAEWVLALALESKKGPPLRIRAHAPMRADFDPVSGNWNLHRVTVP